MNIASGDKDLHPPAIIEALLPPNFATVTYQHWELNQDITVSVRLSYTGNAHAQISVPRPAGKPSSGVCIAAIRRTSVHILILKL